MSLEERHREAKLALARAMAEIHRANLLFHSLLGEAGDEALANAYAYTAIWLTRLHGRLHGLLLSLRILELLDKKGSRITEELVDRLFRSP